MILIHNIADGPEVCRTEYETVCATRQIVHEVEDDVPECVTQTMTKCRDVTQVC